MTAAESPVLEHGTGRVTSTRPMSSKTPENQEIDARTKRARWEGFEIAVARPATDDEPGKVNIRNVSKSDPSAYTVTVDAEGNAVSCTCADWRHREPEGGDKHMRKIESTDAVLVAVTGDIDSGNGDPDECDECQSLPDDWPCAEHYISGDRSLPSE